MAEKEESLSSFWDYDLQPRLEPPPKRAKSSSCPLCAKKQAKLEQEQATNVELVRSIADLTRAKAEVVRELEAARAKLRSLELHQLQHGGGGVPQPAPPDPDAYGSGGGVAARPSTPSPSPPPPPCPFPSSGDTHDEELSGGGGGGGGVAAAASARAAMAGVVAAARRSSKPDEGAAAVAAAAASAAATDALETSGASSKSSESGVSTRGPPQQQQQGGGSSRGVNRGARGPSRAAGLAVGMGRKMPPGLTRSVFPGKVPAPPNTLSHLAERSKGVTSTTVAEKFWTALPRSSSWRMAPAEAAPGNAGAAAGAAWQQQQRRQRRAAQQQRQQQQQQVGVLLLPHAQRATPSVAAPAATSRPNQLLEARAPPPCASSRRTSSCPPEQQASSAAYPSRRSQAPPPPFRPLPLGPETPTGALRSATAASVSLNSVTPQLPAAVHRARERESAVSLDPSWVAELGRGSSAGERWMLTPIGKDGRATTPAAAGSSPPPDKAAVSPPEVAAAAAATSESREEAAAVISAAAAAAVSTEDCRKTAAPATPEAGTSESRGDASGEDGRETEAPAAAEAGAATTSESKEAAARVSTAAAATEDCQMTEVSAAAGAEAAAAADGAQASAADGVRISEEDGAVPARDDEDNGSCGGGDKTLLAEGPSSDAGETLLAEGPTNARDGSLSSLLSKSPCASSVVCGGSPSKGKRPRVQEGEEEGGGEDGTPTRRVPDYSTCVVRHMHVLQCFLCLQYPRQPKDGRSVVFCQKCPRKACLRCQETKVSKDRTGWVPGRDTFGRYYEIPECSECQKGSDDEVPAWVEPPWMEGEGLEISEGDARRLLDKFLHWLQNHELAHFFVDEVDPAEYPDYRETVKKPMNFTRMRERLRAGEYDSRRAGLNSFMEDVDWVRHNCIKFNGERAAISRCAVLLARRAEKYYDTHVAPMVNILRRPGSGGAHRPPVFVSRRRGGNGSSGGGTRNDGAQGGVVHKRKRQGSKSPRSLDGDTSSSLSTGKLCSWIRREATPLPQLPTPYTSSPSPTSTSSQSPELSSFWGAGEVREERAGGEADEEE
ncbi:unnamed protein product, partial [Ectocarpus sp. 12 AP-2014]